MGEEKVKMKYVTCLEDNKKFGFSTRTAYEALESCLYYLNLKYKDNNAKINKTTSGLHLWLENCGKIYWVKND